MTSKISLFNLMKEDMRHKHYMIVLSILAELLLGPVVLLFGFNSDKMYALRRFESNGGGLTFEQFLANTYYRSLLDFFREGYPILLVIIAFVGAMIVGVAGFKHLYSKRMSDLYLSLPVSRESRFMATYLNGLIIWFVPFIAGYVLSFLMGLARIHGTTMPIAPLWTYFGLKLVLVIFSFFVFYHLILLCVVLNGAVFNTFVTIGTLGSYAMLIWAAGTLLCEEFLDTYVYGDKAEFILGFSPLASGFTMTMIDSLNDNIGILITFFVITFIVCVASFFLALHVHKKRPGEQAESGMENKKLWFAIQVIGSVLAGIFGGMLLYAISDFKMFGWCIFGCVFCSVLAFCIFNIIQERSFRAILTNKRLFAASVAASLIVLILFKAGWFGFDKYVAPESNIRSLRLCQISDLQDDEHNIVFDENGYASYHYNQPADTIVINDPATARKILENGAAFSKEYLEHQGTYEYYDYDHGVVTDELNYLSTVKADVKRNFGFSYQRSYRLSTDVAEYLRGDIESEEFRNKIFPISSGLCPYPTSIEIYHTTYISKYSDIVYAGPSSYDDAYKDTGFLASGMDFWDYFDDISDTATISDPAQIKFLMDNYVADFKDTYCMEKAFYNLYEENVEKSVAPLSVYRIRVFYSRDPEDENSYGRGPSMDLDIYTDYSRTLQTIYGIQTRSSF